MSAAGTKPPMALVLPERFRLGNQRGNQDPVFAYPEQNRAHATTRPERPPEGYYRRHPPHAVPDAS